MAFDPKEGVVEYSEFLGLRNNVGVSEFEPGDLSVALNVDIDDAKRIARRKGFSTPVIAGIDRDLWATSAICLGVGSNTLKQIHPNYETTILRTGLASSRPLSYSAVGARVYYSNGVETGCIEGGAHRTWGLEIPIAPVLTVTGGTLPIGKYQVVVTYLRQDGQESGASKASTIELTDIGGISVSSISISADSTVDRKVIYVSSTNGEILYRSGIIAADVIVYMVRESRLGVTPLSTQFLLPPPAGDYIAYYDGYMLVAKGQYIYYSESYAPELFDVRKAVPFLDRITMVAPVDDGVWVGTNSQIVWLQGAPSEWVFREKATYGAIPGTLAYCDGEVLGEGGTKGIQIALFVSKTGTICTAGNTGQFQNLTERRFAFPSMDRGAAIVRRHSGMIQYLAGLQGIEVAGNIVA